MTAIKLRDQAGSDMDITSTPLFWAPVMFAVAGAIYLWVAGGRPEWPKPGRKAKAMAPTKKTAKNNSPQLSANVRIR